MSQCLRCGLERGEGMVVRAVLPESICHHCRTIFPKGRVVEMFHIADVYKPGNIVLHEYHLTKEYVCPNCGARISGHTLYCGVASNGDLGKYADKFHPGRGH